MNYTNTTIIWIQIILVLVFILSRYWFKSIIRTPLLPLVSLFAYPIHYSGGISTTPGGVSTTASVIWDLI